MFKKEKEFLEQMREALFVLNSENKIQKPFNSADIIEWNAARFAYVFAESQKEPEEKIR